MSKIMKNLNEVQF